MTMRYRPARKPFRRALMHMMRVPLRLHLTRQPRHQLLRALSAKALIKPFHQYLSLPSQDDVLKAVVSATKRQSGLASKGAVHPARRDNQQARDMSVTTRMGIRSKKKLVHDHRWNLQIQPSEPIIPGLCLPSQRP